MIVKSNQRKKKTAFQVLPRRYTYFCHYGSTTRTHVHQHQFVITEIVFICDTLGSNYGGNVEEGHRYSP